MASPKGRKGAGNRNQRETARKREQKISSILEAKVLEDIENPEFKLADLPDSTRAQLISLFVPRKKDVDQDLQASLLSLTSSLDHLPDLEDLTKECYRLRKQYDAMIHHIKYFKTVEAQYALVYRKEKIFLNDWIKMARTLYRDGVNYGLGLKKILFTDEEIEAMVTQTFSMMNEKKIERGKGPLNMDVHTDGPQSPPKPQDDLEPGIDNETP